MTLEAILDRTAIRVKTLTGMKECYTITGSSQDDGTLVPIPPSIDSTPVSLLWVRGGRLEAGNTERFVHDVELHIWERGVNGGYGVSTLVPFIERCRVLFRTDLDANETATRVLMRGYGEIFPQTMNNQQVYLVLPILLEFTETHYSSDYAV